MSPSPALPLCVDMDGTLLRTDVLWETLFAALKSTPLAIVRALWQLVTGGRVAFKRALAQAVRLDFSALPHNPELLAALRTESQAGRKLILCTASLQSQAEAVAASMGLFAEIIGTRGDKNLSGSAKAAVLIERFGTKGFDYAGNSHADLAVWRQARSAWLVNTPAGVRRQARRIATIERELDRPSNRFRALLKALRPHQAVKNFLIFVPVLAAHRFTDAGADLAATIALCAFSLLAPATYLLNDALDVAADRLHPRKRNRAFASGALPLSAAAIVIPLLLALSAGLAMLLPMRFAICLGAYLIVTLAYSLRLKRAVLLDAIILGALYVLRIIAGSAATGVAASFWLLAFSMFLFHSLALAKRYTELSVMLASNRNRAEGRGYQTRDLPLLQSLGASSGYIAVLVLALYVNDPTATLLYSHPHLLWGLCLIVLWWLGHLWMETHRGNMHDDPVVFALKDPKSRLAFVFAALLLISAK